MVLKAIHEAGVLLPGKLLRCLRWHAVDYGTCGLPKAILLSYRAHFT